ncbi:MAG: tRNA (N6-threonylcarbamoyladenosine(37)-N6)-methyltransferase TrmO [Methanobacterium sp.]
MKLNQIGVIKSPYKIRTDAPRQGRYSEDISEIIVFEDYSDGLDSIERHGYLLILYWQDKAERDKLKATPTGELKEKGVFSIRSPARPNPIALCLVKVLKIENNTIFVKWLDALDGSPLLDIKPFIKELDCV